MSRNTRSMGSVDAAQLVASTHQAHKIQGYLLDAFTASAIVAVADKLSPTNRDRLNRMNLAQAAGIVWKLVK